MVSRLSKSVVPGSLDALVPVTQNLSVLGSTGSIGRQTLEVAKEEGYRVLALAAGQNAKELAKQVARFQPQYVSVMDEKVKAELMERLRALSISQDSTPIIECGRSSVVRAAQWPEVDTVVAAITGFAGLEPVLAAASSGKKIALANKESLVVAGEMVKALAARTGAWILPVDSEHSAIWQCMLSSPPKSVRRVILTCSGGPFFQKTKDELKAVTLEEALAHPTWSMGGKITIDSATLMNKAFEIIEGCHLFDLPHTSIDVVIHRQSIVHSLVEFKDGALLAQAGAPDMTVPIRYALSFPHRSDRGARPVFDLLAKENATWRFQPVDEDVFPSLTYAREVYEAGGLMPLVLNASNEAAVSRFMRQEIAFADIFWLIRRALCHFAQMADISAPLFDDMMIAHQRVIQYVMEERICP